MPCGVAAPAAHWLLWLLAHTWWLLELLRGCLWLLGSSQGLDSSGERVNLVVERLEVGDHGGQPSLEVITRCWLLRLLWLPGEVLNEGVADNGC